MAEKLSKILLFIYNYYISCLFLAFGGLSDCRTIGPSDYRTVELSDCRIIGRTPAMTCITLEIKRLIKYKNQWATILSFCNYLYSYISASSHTKALFDIIIRAKNGGQVIYGRKIVKNIIIYI
jgi:hypothetical protein